MSRAPLVWGYLTVLEQSSMAHIYLRMCCCTGVSVDPSLCVLLQCQQPRTWPALCWIPALSATGRTYLLFQRKRRESKPFSTLGETLYIQCHEKYTCTVCSVSVCLSVYMSMCMLMYTRVHILLRMCARACVRACVHGCVRVSVCTCVLSECWCVVHKGNSLYSTYVRTYIRVACSPSLSTGLMNLCVKRTVSYPKKA